MEDKEEEIDDDEAISTQVPTSCNLVVDFLQMYLSGQFSVLLLI